MFSTSKKRNFWVPGSNLSIEELYEYIIGENNDVVSLRKYLSVIDYNKKDKVFEAMKSKIPIFMPHGQFKGLLNRDLVKLSGYLFYDIDNIGDDLDEIKSRLIEFNPTMVYRSVSGTGLTILFKVAGLSKDNFNDVYNHVFDLLINAGFKLDGDAKSLNRKVHLSHDPFCFFSLSNELIIDLDNLKTKKVTLGVCPRQMRRGGEGISILNVTLPDKNNIIPYRYLSQVIKIETTYDKDFETFYTIDPMEYHYIYIPYDIPDGKKSKTYRMIINKLKQINKDITLQECFSFIYHVNNRNTIKMDLDRLCWVVGSSYSQENKIKGRIKKIHFNKDIMKIDKEERRELSRKKQSVAAKVNGALRSNSTLEKIIEAKKDLESRGIKATQKEIANVLKINIRTVKRHWVGEYKDPNKHNFKIETSSGLEDIIENDKPSDVDRYIYEMKLRNELGKDLEKENKNENKNRDYPDDWSEFIKNKERYDTDTRIN